MIKDRLVRYIKYKGLSVRRFEISVNAANGYVNSIRKGIGVDRLESIKTVYPDLNITWLLSGEGRMLDALGQQKKNAKIINIESFAYVPMIPVSARAGYLKGYGDEEYIEELPKFPVITDREFKGKYFVFEVSGDSMDNGGLDSIRDNDKVLCREIKRDLWSSKLHIRDWYFLIVHKDEGIIVKQIIEHNVGKSIIKCHSLNPLYEDFTLNLNDVIELYNVIKIVDRTMKL